MNANAFLPPPAISPIATASEEHETNNDNQNKIHVLLQNMSRRDCPPACGCGITTPLASESTYFNASGESKTGAKKRPPEPRVAACFPCRPAQRVHPNRRTLLDRDRAVPASGGDTHARPVAGAALQLVGCHLLHKLGSAGRISSLSPLVLLAGSCSESCGCARKIAAETGRESARLKLR